MELAPYRFGVAAEVRAQMARKQVTQQQLAERTGILYATLRRRLIGEFPLNVDEVNAIATVLGCDPRQFFPNQSMKASA